MGYEIVWTQQSALWLGHESAAVLAVVAAFFGGLALGGLALGGRIEASARPVRWYAGCELVIALWSLVLVAVASPVSDGVVRVIGVQPSAGWQWAVTFGATFLLFLPATAAMGATLPAMERVALRLGDQGRSIAALYASNTAGSVLGVLTAAFWLIPGIGLARTAAICIALNVVCGAAALVVFPRVIPRPPGPPAVDRPRARGALARLALTGFLGIGYEVVVVRVLSQVTEDTVYTFAILLAIYLAGSAAGAAGYQRWLGHRPAAHVGGPPGDRVGDLLMAALAGACAVGAASLWAAGWVEARAHELLGPGVGAALAAEGLLAVPAFGLPTLAMGAVFSHLSRAASSAGVGFGRALGVNLLAAAAAPAVLGVVAIPALGPKPALLLIAAAYLAAVSGRAWARPALWLPALAVAALAAFAPPLRFVDVPDGGRVISYQDGVMASVSVVEDASGVARLRINNRQQEGSSATGRVDGRQAWLPLLLHPAPRRALFLGLGTGVTASAATDDPALEVDVVELLPEVIAASSHFVSGAPRLHVMAADARRYVRASDRPYDLIVADNFHPARSGSAALYTVEHFEAVRQRLTPDGVFCQWLPVHQLDLGTLRSIVRSFLAVYPISWAIIASNSLDTPVLGLIARRDQGRFDVPRLRDRLSRLASPERRASLGLEDELAVLGSMIAGPRALERFAAGAPPNTDDLPIVAYTAPRATYAPDSTPRDRLIALLRELSIEPADLVLPIADPSWPARLAAYWTARRRFVESGRDVRPSPDVTTMLAQVREPLLSVLRISPDFRPAYDPLLAMASALARSDVAGARTLLAELSQVQPARSEAIRLLAALGAAPSADPAAR
ncbi:MAG TPA: fused MFS/spermidine synthase [Kofleriaceae bacterium]|jgi:spermidine synthase|nr:fused MFS/spermidine synthase [Kofleriaceae bacterium]